MARYSYVRRVGFVSNVTGEAIDTAVQICGASGVGKELPLSDFYESARPTSSNLANVRHKRTVADYAFADERVPGEEFDPVTRF